MRASAFALTVCAALVLAACEDVSVNPVINRIGTPIASPSFSNDIEPILSQTCATSGACHEGPSSIYGLDLRAGAAYASLVNVASRARSSMLRVKPGDPDSSFMFRVLSTDSTYRVVGPSTSPYYRMPLTENPMPAAIVQTIANWIRNGAPNN